jgi:4-hydroxybutyrate CoA-transferase
MLRAKDGLAAAEALLPDADRVTVLAAMSPQQPDVLLGSLVAVARNRSIALTLLVADLAGAYAFLDEAGHEDVRAGRVQLVALAGAVPRALSPFAGHFPSTLWEIDRDLGDGTIPFDVFVARVEGNPHGDEAGIGSMVGYTPTAIASDAVVGLEVVPPMLGLPETAPLALGRAEVVLATEGGARVARSPRAPSAAASRIAELVASLVPDGATVQLGLGAVPDAVVPHLAGKRDLGIHSGILPGSIRGLLASPHVTGARKSRDAGWHVATGVLDDGTDGPWAPNVRLDPISRTHDPRLLAEQERFWAINSAFEIDLAGNVNAEYIAGARIASAGGQLDFFRAGHASTGGASVLALPSRARDGTPRICHRLPSADLSTSTSAVLDYVVTEHGVAELVRATDDERVERLIAIAHPEDRQALAASRGG